MNLISEAFPCGREHKLDMVRFRYPMIHIWSHHMSAAGFLESAMLRWHRLLHWLDFSVELVQCGKTSQCTNKLICIWGAQVHKLDFNRSGTDRI
jgi:hypothetical protein